MVPNVDLVIVFQTPTSSLSKQQIREEVGAAEERYTLLLETLRKGGLRAVGRRGEKEGEILVLVSCR